MPPGNLDRRRALTELGQRAVDYYLDTGFCVFCDADDCENMPHDSDCNVGELSGIEVDEKRKEEKAKQRRMADEALQLLNVMR